jgi:hypothetical protein
LIQRTGDALAASGRFEVMCDIQIPLTETANDLLTSQNSQHDLAKIRLKSDSKAVRIVTVDLVVVDPEAGWAGAYDVKRGNGATESRKRRPLEHDLRGIRLVLANHLLKIGYEGITSTDSGIIDYYGMSGFSREIKIIRDELDAHFGVPVVGHVDAMTEALKGALHAEIGSDGAGAAQAGALGRGRGGGNRREGRRIARCRADRRRVGRSSQRQAGRSRPAPQPGAALTTAGRGRRPTPASSQNQIDSDFGRALERERRSIA